MHKTIAFGLILLVGAGWGCSDSDSNEPPTESGDTGVESDTNSEEPDASSDSAHGDVPDADNNGPHNPDCDPLVPEVCALPWPSNAFLKTDSERTTGLRLSFGTTTLPATEEGLPFDPAPYSRMDGYSLGTPIITWFPELDLSTLPSETDPSASLAPDALIVMLEVRGDTVRRVPYWVELDLQSSKPDTQLVYVRPMVILEEATRYIVAFRQGLKNNAGQLFEPSAAFTALRDGNADHDPALTPRVPQFESIFETLETKGVARQDLLLAWDFVTNSGDALFRDMLHMRDDALARLETDGLPELRITSTERFLQEDDGSGMAVDPHMAFRIEGTFSVPDYTVVDVPDINGNEGTILDRDSEGAPRAGDRRRDATFFMLIPHTALSGDPHQLVLYGHGLMGSGIEVFAGYNRKIAFDHKAIFFSANMTGMSSDDINAVLAMLLNLSHFPWVSDRLHQGLAEHVLLARIMKEGLSGLDLIADNGIVVDNAEVFYSGISQGGIFGGSVVALSPDIHRGHLGVPGQNYSMLLNRSTDFTVYQVAMSSSYPDANAQALLLAAIQILWDRVEQAAYLRHISKAPFPGQQPNQVLMAPAKGDYQVANITVETAARSGLGLALMQDYGRVVFGVEEQSYPHQGSAIVMYDYGNPWPLPGNMHPPVDPVLGDPHGKPRKEEHHNMQMFHFFQTGEIIDVCGDDGCTPD